MEFRKKTMMIGMALLVGLFFISLASAEFWGCFEYGEVVQYCGGYKSDWTCGSTNGCEKCLSVYQEAEDCYIHGSWPICNRIPKECSSVGGNQSFDGEAPELTLNSPVQDALYTSRSVLLDFNLDEVADVYYLDNINGRGRWTRVCSNCNAGQSYSRKRSFTEGLNNLTFKAKDVIGNTAYLDVVFFIDSKEPKISGVEPRTEFIGSTFYVSYTEENIDEVKLHYGNSQTGFNELTLTGCPSGTKQSCQIDVNLIAYDEQEIEYWFVVKDMAGNIDESKVLSAKVDETFPIINSLDYRTDGKYVYFDIEVDEANFDEVSYSYIDTKGKLKEKKLCSKLINGVCEKKVSFKDGTHGVDIVVTDEAGHAVAQNVEFFIDSKEPKIKSAEPKKGFANGDFYVEFDEENPQTLTLHYGTFADMRLAELDIETDCVKDRYHECLVSVPLEDYNGQEIRYYFRLTDKVGQIVESKATELDVDTTLPVLNNPESFWQQGEERYKKYIYFNLDITEDNLDEVGYSYRDYRGRLKEKRLCSKLRDGVCEAKKSFRNGDELLSVYILDDAGNAIVESINFVMAY